jgi:hypothetical protein
VKFAILSIFIVINHSYCSQKKKEVENKNKMSADVGVSTLVLGGTVPLLLRSAAPSALGKRPKVSSPLNILITHRGFEPTTHGLLSQC